MAPTIPRGTHSGSPGRSGLRPSPQKPPAAGRAPGPPSCWRGSGAPWAAVTALWPVVSSGDLGGKQNNEGHHCTAQTRSFQGLPGPPPKRLNRHEPPLPCHLGHPHLTQNQGWNNQKAGVGWGGASPGPPNAAHQNTHTLNCPVCVKGVMWYVDLSQ